MIPIRGSNPEVNVVYIGAFILAMIYHSRMGGLKISSIIKVSEEELSVSIDHVILALDWLYTISAIDYKGKEVLINEVK